MSLLGGRDRYSAVVPDSRAPAAPQEVGVGKGTLVEQLAVQQQSRAPGLGPTTRDVQAAAAHGTQGTGGSLPHRATIQQLFGRHDVSNIQAHTDDAAREGAAAMGAQAFASGDHVAFAGAPDLHTAAHEAAHVVQQRSGVQLKGGVGEVGDPYEQHADQVADAVVQGKSAEGLLGRYAGGSGDGAMQATAVQRQAHPPEPGHSTVASAAATTAAPPPATAAAPPPEPVDTTITDTTRVESVEILHAEEIFADLPANTVTKKHAFDRLNKAVHAETKAEQTVAATEAAEEKAKAAEAKAKAAEATPKTAKAIAKAMASATKATAKATKAADKAAKSLTAAKTEVTAATDGIEALIVAARLPHDERLNALKAQLAAAAKEKKKDAKKIAELKKSVATRKEEIATEVADLKHTDAGHTDDSVYSPIATDVTHHDFAFADGEHVKVHDHVVSYATTVSFGVDSEGAIDHTQVRNVMATAGLSESRRKILEAISGFEGGFDTVNTYDRAKVTWGFVQWTGGSHSDLTATLTIIKAKHPEAFAKAFQAYGIDIVGDELVITPPDGSGMIRGDAAASAIMQNPRLAAVLAHAGRNDEVQKGEVQAASQLEIEKALSQKVQFDTDKHKISTTAGALITSEYGVGLLANTFVHSGSGAAEHAVHAAVVSYLAKHPYVAGDEAWRAGAEAAIISGLAAKDSDRAASLRGQLKTDAGSFQ